MKHLVLLLTLFYFSASAHAESLGREGNGGDPLALEFQQLAIEAFKEANESPALNIKLSAVNFREILDGITILVVDYPLVASKAGIEQNSVAMNFPGEKRILINRLRWKALKDIKLKRALALHEVLGIAGLEVTGSYPISRSYLELVSGQEKNAAAVENNGATDKALARSTQFAAMSDPNQSYFDTLENWFAEGKNVSFAEVYRTVNVGRCFHDNVGGGNKPEAYIMGGVSRSKNEDVGPGFYRQRKVYSMANPIVHPATYDKFPFPNGHADSWDYDFYDEVTQMREVWSRLSEVSEGESYLSNQGDTDNRADGKMDAQVDIVKYGNYYVTRVSSLKPFKRKNGEILPAGYVYSRCYTFHQSTRE